MVRRQRGRYSGVNIVTVDFPGLELPTDACPACESGDVKVVTAHSQSVDFLQPVVGEPYPTYAVNPAKTINSECRACGQRWARSSFTDERIPQEDVAYDVHTRLPINDPSHWG